jgi:hypothetical protein
MNVNDFLEHAQGLAEDGRPAWCRSAVSRAYYAAHHAAVDFLFRAGVVTPGGGERHRAAVDPSIDHPIHTAAIDLRTLLRKRTRADYDWQKLDVENQEHALDLVQNAREIIDAFDTCLDDPDREHDICNHFQAWIPAHGSTDGLRLASDLVWVVGWLGRWKVDKE